MFRKILVCSDGSERSVAAASIAAEVAKCRNAHLTLLHVCSIPEVDEPFPGAPPLSKSAIEAFVSARHLAVIERTGTAISEVGIHYDILEETGNPVEVISRIAENQGFDLVVLGSRARRSDKSPELGSVSLGVIQRVHCPVLVAK